MLLLNDSSTCTSFPYAYMSLILTSLAELAGLLSILADMALAK